MTWANETADRLLKGETRCLADLWPNIGWQSRAVDAGNTLVDVSLGTGHVTIAIYTLGRVGTCYTAALLADDARALAIKLAKGADRIAPASRTTGDAA
jgi:hypothetical protein